MNANLNKSLNSFYKRYLVLFVFLTFFSCYPPVLAATNYNLSISNKEVANYILAADNSKDSTEKIKNYMLASNAINKKTLSKDDAKLLAILNYLIGKESLNIANFPVAFKAFQKSYGFLKLKNINKNDELSFQNLYMLYTLSGIYIDEKTELEYLEEIANTQPKLETSHLNEFKTLYMELYDIYSKQKDLNKASLYKEKLNKLSVNKRSS